jgi:hypothetical protein
MTYADGQSHAAYSHVLVAVEAPKGCAESKAHEDTTVRLGEDNNLFYKETNWIATSS